MCGYMKLVVFMFENYKDDKWIVHALNFDMMGYQRKLILDNPRSTRIVTSLEQYRTCSSDFPTDRGIGLGLY